MKNRNHALPDLGYLGLGRAKDVFYQLSPSGLVEAALQRHEGVLTTTGVLAIDTGEFTGRSPKDRFIVKDEITRDAVWWSDTNIAFPPGKFDFLFDKVIAYLNTRELFVRDACLCANEKFHLEVRVITETASHNLFSHHLFMRPEVLNPANQPEWTIIAVPNFKADPLSDGTRQSNFSIINFSRRIILIGGTGYTGEIKKAMFSVLNFTLPYYHKVLPMHCAANAGTKGDTAIFFGLSGTGKTTLSADPERALIGDDEHGWSDYTVFNFEGGCYAKCANLSPESEPQIYEAIKFGALLENVGFYPNTRQVNFADISKTENTRVAYPLDYMSNVVRPSISSLPRQVFFLTADAFGVLPPVARLSPEQAMYYFISGYTAKVAGTETGITEPSATFSACFGKAFLPLHPSVYANLLGKKIRESQADVWLINTGWTGGPYGTGKRISLRYTRAIIAAAISGELARQSYSTLPVFNLQVPQSCPGVPAALLNPRQTWGHPQAYDDKAAELAGAFFKNFEQFTHCSALEVVNAGPELTISV